MRIKHALHLWFVVSALGLVCCDKSGTGMTESEAFVRPDVDDAVPDEELEAPEMEVVRIFQEGVDGYHSYRIPCLARAANGDLIAFAEGRKHTSLDYGDIDLVYKRSVDNGATWSDLHILVDEGEGTWGNPTAVTDDETGRIWLFLSWNDDSHAQVGGAFDGKTYDRVDTWGQRRVFTTVSDDHGETWSTPVDMTETLLPADFTWDAMGPGIGIQVEHGPASGRLIIPAQERNIYSDDHGETWQYQRVPANTGETAIVELRNGLLMRNDRGVTSEWENNRFRFVATGSIESGFSSFRADRGLPDSRCQASMLRYSWAPSRILFLNPANNEGSGMPYRCQMTVRVSTDEGATWTASRRLYPELTAGEACEQGYGGYSSMMTTADHQIGALVEHNSDPLAGAAMDRRHSIDFHRFNLSWIMDGEE